MEEAAATEYTGRAKDNVKNEGSLSVTVNLDKTAPVVDVGPDLEVAEGSELAFSASVSDNLDDQVVFGWTFGDDGTASQDLEPGHTYTDNGSFEATLTATDHADHTSSDTLTVSVLNAAPVVKAGEDRTAQEGTTVEISATFTDAGILDTHTAEVDWGDGTTSAAELNEEDGAGGLRAEHVYADNGVYAARVTVTDNDGDSGEAAIELTIENAAPTIAAGEDQAAAEGSVISLAPATFHDQGTLDTHAATVDWGDGTG
ncbi:MAG: PKD domain-containing protein, partial [Elusimicrobiota bacterium]